MKVHCEYTRLGPVVELKPHPKNPNTHPHRQIELLGKILQTQGWRAPIVVLKVTKSTVPRGAFLGAITI